jgi:hypothetical protein
MSKTIDQAIFRDGQDYWQVAENIKDIYMSEGSLLTLLDFERVLDELDLYAFKNWQIGELVADQHWQISCELYFYVARTAHARPTWCP